MELFVGRCLQLFISDISRTITQWNCGFFLHLDAAGKGNLGGISGRYIRGGTSEKAHRGMPFGGGTSRRHIRGCTKEGTSGEATIWTFNLFICWKRFIKKENIYFICYRSLQCYNGTSWRSWMTQSGTSWRSWPSLEPVGDHDPVWNQLAIMTQSGTSWRSWPSLGSLGDHDPVWNQLTIMNQLESVGSNCNIDLLRAGCSSGCPGPI